MATKTPPRRVLQVHVEARSFSAHTQPMHGILYLEVPDSVPLESTRDPGLFVCSIAAVRIFQEPRTKPTKTKKRSKRS